VIVAATITFFADHLHNDHERIQVRTLVVGRGCEFATGSPGPAKVLPPLTVRQTPV